MTIFISNMDQFDELVATGSKVTVLLGGETVYMTHDKKDLEALQSEAGDRFVLQPPRIASRGGWSKKKEYLYVAVSKQAADYAQNYRGTVALAADHYLAYGLSQKRDCIVIGGGRTEYDELNLEFFVFNEQRLVETVERTTSTNIFMLESALHDVIDRYPSFAILWCDPLGEPPLFELTRSEHFEFIGDAPIRNLITRKIFSKSQTVEEPWGIFKAFSVACIGAAIFLCTAGYQWMELSRARQEYREEVKGYEAAYSNSTQSLDLLRQREYLMNRPGDAVDRVKMINNLLLNTAAISGVVIHSVKVFSGDDQEATATIQSTIPGSQVNTRDDFRLEFSVPQTGAGARDQAEPIVAMLNHLTGMTIRVIAHNPETLKVGDEEKPYWHYTLGGGRNAS